MQRFLLFVVMMFALACAQNPAANKAKLMKQIKTLSNVSATERIAAQENKVLGMKSMLALRQAVEAAVRAKNAGNQQAAVKGLQAAQADLEQHYMSIAASQEWGEAKNETDHTLAILKRLQSGVVNNKKMDIVNKMVKKLEPLKEVQAKANLIAEVAAEEADEMFEEAEEQAEESQEQQQGPPQGMQGMQGAPQGMQGAPQGMQGMQGMQAPPQGMQGMQGQPMPQPGAFMVEQSIRTPSAFDSGIGMIAAGLIVASALGLTVKRHFAETPSAEDRYIAIA